MKKISRSKFLVSAILGSICLVLADAFWFERYFIQWKTFNLHDKETGCIKVIQLSDLHLKSVKSIHLKIVDKINKLKPDLVLFSGDAIDDHKNLATFDHFLENIDKSIPKIGITGNWEYWGNVDIDSLNELYEKHNGTLLINENKTLTLNNQKLSIIGIDDFIGGNADFNKAIQHMENRDKTIVLSHCPAHFDSIIQEKNNMHIDLVLSGHTHGGQINIFGIVPFKPRGSGKYLKGWYESSETKLYVSKGIGTSILPVRIGARAEVSMFYI